MIKPPDMHDEANQHERDQEELVKQQMRSHDNAPFPDGERRLLYRIDSRWNYPSPGGTRPFFDHMGRRRARRAAITAKSRASSGWSRYAVLHS
jgi:hypothetical protein